MWIILALAASICFALVHVLDEYCVEEIFEKAWFGTITSALASLVIFLPLPLILPFTGWSWPSFQIIAISIFAGILIQMSQLLYFNALSKTNAGTVAAYWNLIPAILPILSFFILNRVLTPYQYTGIVILILASNVMLLADHNFETRISAFFLMVGASILQAVSYLLQDFVFENTGYLEGFILFTFGIILVGTLPLACPPVLRAFRKGERKMSKVINLFVGIEIINLIALAFAQKSLQIGIPSLVASVETTIPGFTFLITLGAISFFQMRLDENATSNLLKKITALALMAVGVYFVS